MFRLSRQGSEVGEQADGFFPKIDNIQVAAKAGIKVIMQPGGSIADKDVIKAAEKAKMAMVFTGVRHFKH